MALEMASVSLPFDGFMADYDFAIIGGGLNGVSLARDAAGRGLRVILLEQGDLGGAASSATPRLIHGDLSVLERRGFRRVRRALAERRIWLRIAPHLVRPMRFVIPAHSDERPPWLLRVGLLLYDSLTSRSGLPATATLDITHHPVGNALKRPFGTAFEYSDCVVDDSRLVVLTALDAAERGAVIRTGARCVRADRTDTWRLAVVDRGHRRTITARALAKRHRRLDVDGRRDRAAAAATRRGGDADEPDHRPAIVRFR
ncbi:glycerol-3-phosphate dehydrogenase [Bradyrhizobium sp. GM22.5]